MGQEILKPKQIHHHYYHQTVPPNLKNNYQNKNINVSAPYKTSENYNGINPENIQFRPKQQTREKQYDQFAQKQVSDQGVKNLEKIIQQPKQQIREKQNCQFVQKQVSDQEVKNLQKIIQQYEEGIEKAQQYGKKMQDPEKFQQFKKESLNIYIQNIRKLNFPEDEVSNDGTCLKSIVGKISSGKSSLLNTLLGLKLQTGMGETTNRLELVYNENGVKIVDTPGQNEDFNSFKVQNVSMIAQCNQVYILYPDSLKNVENLVRIVVAIKPKYTYLIRTQCDKASKKDNKTIDEEVKTDYKVLSQWGIEGIKIFTTSSKNLQLYQNKQVRQMLMRHPQRK